MKLKIVALSCMVLQIVAMDAEQTLCKVTSQLERTLYLIRSAAPGNYFCDVAVGSDEPLPVCGALGKEAQQRLMTMVIINAGLSPKDAKLWRSRANRNNVIVRAELVKLDPKRPSVASVILESFNLSTGRLDQVHAWLDKRELALVKGDDSGTLPFPRIKSFGSYQI